MAYSKIIRALYDYTAQDDDELNFAEGDVLAVVDERHDDDWYSACLVSSPESVGMCPKTYVQEIDPIESLQASYNYEAQDSTELSFLEGESLEILHKIDEDWWLARNSVGECGMVPSNYFAEQEIQDGSYDESEKEPLEDDYPEEQETEQLSEMESIQPSKVDLLKESSTLQCDALFLDASNAKCKGRLYLETALFLSNGNEVEHEFAFDSISKYCVDDSKLHLKGGQKFAIGLGKKDAKQLSDSLKEYCVEDDQVEQEEKGYFEPIQAAETAEEHTASAKSSPQMPPPPLPERAPIVVAPKIPESYQSSSSQKIPMVVGVSFEGTERDEISIIKGEEVFLLPSTEAEDSQFVRIEKTNGLQGIVPKTFLQTRSDYQKAQEEEKRAVEEQKRLEQEMAKVSLESATQSIPEMPKPTCQTESAVSYSNPTEPASAQTVANPAKANDPWSALAKTGKVAKPQAAASSQSSVELKDARIWKDKTGKFQVEAEFVSCSEGQVTILKANGSKVTVPLSVLSDRDCEYVAHKTGIPIESKSKQAQQTTSTIVKGFDWLVFFSAFALDAAKAREYAIKFASQGFEESMIASFTSD